MTSAEPDDAAKLARSDAARDRPGRTVHGPNGAPIPVLAVHVADFRAEGGPDAVEVEVIAATSAAWAPIAGCADAAPDA